MKGKIIITYCRKVSTLVQNAIIEIANVNIAPHSLKKIAFYCIVTMLWVKRLSERSSI